jgi:plasmid replication initiation protein
MKNMVKILNMFRSQNEPIAVLPPQILEPTEPPPEPVVELYKPREVGMTLAKLRKTPAGDNQRDFFVPVVCDVPIKDDVNLMDVAPYRLSTKTTATRLEYRLNGAEIIIESSTGLGLATVKDYDFIIHMISYLNAEMQAYRRGERKDIPPNRFRPSSYEMLKFCRRGKGGKQSQIVEDGLGRLQGTNITITCDNGTRREAKGFGLIDGWNVISKTRTGKIQHVEIGIPSWIYDGIIKTDKPSVLTLHPDYFLLDLPLDRSLYRLARRTAGQGESFYTMRDVHHRSGSTRKLEQFSYDMGQLIGHGRRILDYDLTLVKAGKNTRLEMRHVKPEPSNQLGLPLLKTTTYEKVKKFAAGRDVYALESEWREWVKGMNKPLPNNADAAYINFCKKKCGGL